MKEHVQEISTVSGDSAINLSTKYGLSAYDYRNALQRDIAETARRKMSSATSEPRCPPTFFGIKH
ncbi:hypothetical protein BM221_005096 [Beauveria bassiana]|uniref:Uncharacterized protein n=1 Tax=Beauveria bassiana TaxID=176275 RepID=A0A2N6NML3_BEABA|nr:hypothetical protein BM221_005096 [Beauveria bassiana]